MGASAIASDLSITIETAMVRLETDWIRRTIMATICTFKKSDNEEFAGGSCVALRGYRSPDRLLELMHFCHKWHVYNSFGGIP